MTRLAVSAAACALAACVLSACASHSEIETTVPRVASSDQVAVTDASLMAVDAKASDDDYAPICRIEKSTGSRIATQRCYSPEELARADDSDVHQGSRQDLEDLRNLQMQRAIQDQAAAARDLQRIQQSTQSR